MEDNIDRKIKKRAALSGIVLGVISLAFTIFLFYYITAITTSFLMMAVIAPIFLSYVFPLVCAVLFCNDLRKNIGGYWNFRQATTGIFIMFFLCYLVSLSGNLLFSKVVEPDMVNKTETAFIGSKIAMMKKRGDSPQIINAQVAETKKQLETQSPTAGNVAKSFAATIVMTFVISLIFAALFKRERLQYVATTQEPDATV